MAKEIITLSNGKKVANFSSPHSFTFTDGSEIPAVDAEESVRLKVTFNERVDQDGDVFLDFTLSSAVLEEMEYWMKLWENKEVDVVFCCLPMITAIKDEFLEFDHQGHDYQQYMDSDPFPDSKYAPIPNAVISIFDRGNDHMSLKSSPFRAVRMEDRIKKLLSIEKQCI